MLVDITVLCLIVFEVLTTTNITLATNAALKVGCIRAWYNRIVVLPSTI